MRALLPQLQIPLGLLLGRARAVFFTQTPGSNATLFGAHPHRHTPKQSFASPWASVSPVRLTDKLARPVAGEDLPILH